jgi:hypothetical protein
MKNRYGDEYNFKKLDENLYTIEGDLQYWRFGFREDSADLNDLAFADPSGGPFIEPGMKIDGRVILRIRSGHKIGDKEYLVFEVE